MSGTHRAIVSVTNDLYTDNRVNKICLFLHQQGYDVLLVGRKRKNSMNLSDRPYNTKRFNLLFDKGPFFYAEYNFRLFWFLLFHKSELLVANDLDTLLANYLASRCKKSTRLVYDSHEYFTQVPELVNRPRVQKIWVKIEKYIFPKLETVYTVNDSIAQEYFKLYNKEIKVVRNISPKWKPEKSIGKKELRIPEDKFVIILQGAGINIQRGAEEAVEAMKFLDKAVLLIVGDGDVINQLKKYVTDFELGDKVLFFGKRPYSELMHFTSCADVGLTLDKPNNLNYLYSLPNKVFDYIHAGTPIICTDLPEVRKIVDRHDVGIILKELSPRILADSISKLMSDEALLTKFKQNCLKASEVESWEGECKILEEIYPPLGK